MTYLQRKKLAFINMVNKVKGFIRTVSGVPPLALTDCVDDESIINYIIEGNCVQNGSPEPDNPVKVESVGDLTQNLFDLNSVELVGDCVILDNSIHFTGTGSFDVFLPSGQYTLSFKNNNKGTCYVRDGKVDSGFIVSINPTETTKTFNYSANVDGYLRISSFSKGLVLSDIQIEKGSTVSAYEPYGYKIPIVCSGKNLFDKDNFTQSITSATGKKSGYDYTITGNKGALNSASSGTFLIKLPKNIVAKNKTISISVYITMLEYGDINNQIRAWTEANDSAKDHQLSQNFSLNERVRLSWVFTNVDYELSGFRFYINGNKILFEMDTLQIETNATATDYEPYVEPVTTTIYLDEPLRKIGAYADYIDFENCKVVRNIVETILKGTEDCYMSSTGGTNERIIYDLLVFKAMGSSPSLCSHANTTTDANVGWSGTKFVMQVASTDVRFYRPFYCGVAEFIEKTPFGWKQYLAQLYSEGNPFKVYCVRSEMSEEIINIPKQPTIKGTTIYSIGTEIQPSNMSATYYSTSKE